MATARADIRVSAGATELIICTPGGLKRITPADRGSSPDQSVPSTETLCPVCLAAHSAAVEASPAMRGSDLLVIPVPFDGREATLRLLCGSTEAPARAPPILV